MPVPVNFSPWEHFQNVVRRIHNTQVKAFFKADLLDDDITSSEGAVRYACLIDDKDTASMVIARFLFFAIHCGYLESLLENVFYGIPKLDLQQKYTYVNQVTLLFSESYSDWKKSKKRNRKRFRVSFRWLDNPNTERVTQADVTALINKINHNFPESYGHYCGANSYIHYNPKIYDKRFVIPARNESDAIRFYERLFKVMNLDFDPRKLRKAERTITAVKEYKTILGEHIIVDDDIPLATVILKQAILHLHGATKKEVIISRNI